MNEIKRGLYRHFKGNEYRVIAEAKGSEDGQDLVIYQDAKDEGKIWARPKEMFLEEVEVDGEKKPRFELISEEDGEAADWEEKYKRALADYQNLLKQKEREREEFIKYSLTDFLHDILPVYDHLKLSLRGLGEEESKNAWVQGVKHVLKQFKDVLAARGVEEIETSGLKFDHNTMEALDGSGDNIKQEIMPGYKLNGRVIRPAKVIVEE